MITYKKQSWTVIKVFLDGKRVGSIRSVLGGWQYFPYRSDVGGEVFETISEVKNSIERD